MKKTLLIFILILSVSSFTALYAQEKENVTYIFKNSEKITSLKDYSTAISKAQLDCYRMLNQRRSLKFDNGLIVELLSANELEKNRL